MPHEFYSLRTGSNPNSSSLPLEDVVDLFVRVVDQLTKDSFFNEAFGFWCVDTNHIDGNVKDIELEMFLTIRKNTFGL